MDQSRRIVTNAPNFLITVILSVVSAVFMLKDKKLICDTLSRHCPEWIKKNLGTMREGLFRAVGGYFRAQGILMSITGIIAITGLLILRSPYALILGLLLAFLDFLPFFGTGFVLLPWAAFSLATAAYGQAVGLVVIYGTVFVMRQILEPKVLSEQIGVYPLVTLMAIFIGYRLFGFIGIFVGPALVMMFIAMNKVPPHK
jgi:sporulation integral membrane protein YtvI